MSLERSRAITRSSSTAISSPRGAYEASRWRPILERRGQQAERRQAQAMPNDAILTVERLSKSFGGVDAVRDVSFDVRAGELVALIGPNGAGKTTCFNLVNGQLRPDSGTVTLMGARIDGLPPRAISRMGVGRTFQVAALFASMTVRENIQLALLARAGAHRSVGARATDCLGAEADALLERVRMTEFAGQG